MLLKYRNDYHKIAVDMLSLLPNMNKINRLNEEMEWYSSKDDRIFYLWKDQSDDWKGLLGVEERSDNILVRRIILSPESYNLENCYKMLDELTKIYMNKRIIGTLDTSSICVKWEQSKQDES